MAKNESKVQKSVPGGNGGRLPAPQETGLDGLPYHIDPDGEIYSGMTKRLARSDGTFCKYGAGTDKNDPI